ncbi:hypothetical protein B0T13DRAFT_471379 [Neurospora crassa]|nr:hypothetical protein B0T13DRAFT_471379 [Neurospora crassa]
MAFSNHNERYRTVGVWFLLTFARQGNLQVRNIGYLIWLVIFRGRVNNTPKSVQVPLYSWCVVCGITVAYLFPYYIPVSQCNGWMAERSKALDSRTTFFCT